MPTWIDRVRLSIAGLLVVGVALTLVPAVVEAQRTPYGAELRLGARANNNGSISVGLQRRDDGRWRGTIPSLSKIPSDAVEGQWYASSSVSVPMRRIEAVIRTEPRNWSRAESASILLASGDREWRIDQDHRLDVRLSSDALSFEVFSFVDEETSPLAPEISRFPAGEGSQLVRVLGRRLSGDIIELGLQRLVATDWQPVEQPVRTRVTLSEPNEWTFGEAFTSPLMPPVLRGELRKGATIDTRDGRIQMTVDGQVKSSQCGVLRISNGLVTFRVDSLSEDCHSSATLFSVCPGQVHGRVCDFQQNQVYQWESRHDLPARIDLSDAQMARIVRAVYSDYVVGTRPPAVARSDFLVSYWSSGAHTVYMADNHKTLDTLLHETAHAIVDGVGWSDPGHGANYTVTILSVLGRYAPLVDTRAMQLDAERLGVQLSERVHQPNSDDGIEVVRELICGLGEPGAAMCKAFASQAQHLGAYEHFVKGSFIGSGQIGNLSWYSDFVDDGSLWTSASVYASIDGQPESQAKLQLACDGDSQFLVRLWWPGESELSGDVEYQIGSFGWIGDRWIVRQTPWTDEGRQYLRATGASEVMESLIWASSAGYSWSIQIGDEERGYEVTFDLAGLFGTPAQANLALCGLDHEQVGADRFVGRGDLPNGWYGAGEDDDGLFRSYLRVGSNERRGEQSVAELLINCGTKNDLKVDIMWRATEAVPPELSHRVGDRTWRTEQWRTSSDTRSEDKRAFHTPLDPAVFLHQLIWLADGSETLFVQYEDDGTTYHASFDLAGAFDTPVQRNLALCGTRSEVRDPVASVIDWGRFGENFWWGVTVADEENPRHESYEPRTVVETHIGLQTSLTDADEAIARLMIRCDQDVPRVGIYWEVDPAVDKTVKIGLADGEIESREWSAGASNWGEYRFKWNGIEGSDALELWTDLYWAAQRGALLTVESHARNRPSQTYTATFDLDGLFETPVQPNLARCGR